MLAIDFAIQYYSYSVAELEFKLTKYGLLSYVRKRVNTAYSLGSVTSI